MDRDLVILRLIDDEAARLVPGREALRLMRVLETMFRGFGNMSEAELASELHRRGLRAEFELPAEPEDELDDDEDDDDEEDELRAALEKAASISRE